MKIEKSIVLILGFFLGSFSLSEGAADSGSASPRPAGANIAVKGESPSAPNGVTDLKFMDFFKMPIGPRGLETTEKLQRLDGRRVRMVGYMARQEAPIGGLIYLTPFPVFLGEEDEPLADDLPPSTVFVHVPNGGKPVPQNTGLIRLTGRLSVGSLEEADGRVSMVRLLLDPELTAALMGESPARREDPEKRAIQ